MNFTELRMRQTSKWRSVGIPPFDLIQVQHDWVCLTEVAVEDLLRCAASII